MNVLRMTMPTPGAILRRSYILVAPGTSGRGSSKSYEGLLLILFEGSSRTYKYCFADARKYRRICRLTDGSSCCDR